MSTLTTIQEGPFKSKENSTSIQTCIIMDKPTKSSIQHLAALRHTTVSHLVNVAVEEYLKKCVESQREIMFQ